MTRNRREWLPKAIRCYLKQDYPNREMLILADGQDVSDLVPEDERIRLVHLERRVEIGEKRNFGCELAGGEIIAHFDDDDWSAPGRLSDQVSRLLDHGVGVTGYRTMKFLDMEVGTWWLYKGTPQFALGTSLCYTKAWWAAHRFQSLQVGEDNAYVHVAAVAGQLVTTEAGEMMVATIHQNNTSPRQLCGSDWELLG